jgi:hypothetical protein
MPFTNTFETSDQISRLVPNVRASYARLINKRIFLLGTPVARQECNGDPRYQPPHLWFRGTAPVSLP